MKFNLYSLRDDLSHVFLAPFVARSDIDAIRNIRAAKADSAMAQTPIGQSPKDFSLYCIGVYDDDDGSISGHPPNGLGGVDQIWA